MREALVEKRLRTLYWVDTRDMVSDGLTKGSVERTEIIRLYEKNVWQTIGDKPVSVSLYAGDSEREASIIQSGVRNHGNSPENAESWIFGYNWKVNTTWTSI